MSENTDYSKLRLDVLEKMIYQRGIECKMKKDEMTEMFLQTLLKVGKKFLRKEIS